MTDPTHPHGYDPDDLMAWRRGQALNRALLTSIFSQHLVDRLTDEEANQAADLYRQMSMLVHGGDQ